MSGLLRDAGVIVWEQRRPGRRAALVALAARVSLAYAARRVESRA